MADDPKVFADGVLTATFGMHGARIYAGQQQLRCVKSARFEFNSDGSVHVELEFKSGCPQMADDVDLEMRAARTLPQVHIK